MEGTMAGTMAGCIGDTDRGSLWGPQQWWTMAVTWSGGATSTDSATAGAIGDKYANNLGNNPLARVIFSPMKMPGSPHDRHPGDLNLTPRPARTLFTTQVLENSRPNVRLGIESDRALQSGPSSSPGQRGSARVLGNRPSPAPCPCRWYASCRGRGAEPPTECLLLQAPT